MDQRLESNLLALRGRIARAATAAGRAGDAVRLVAVTKGVDASVCADLARLGQRDLGENRVQDLAVKHAHCAALGLDVRWHLIGHLQRNKARRAVQLADEIHSVDSLRLAEAVARIATEESRRMRVYLEVKLVANDARGGFAPEEVASAVARVRELEPLSLAGLMTMAPEPTSAPGVPTARETFDRLAALRRSLRAEDFDGGRVLLSMGMSSDFEDAIAAGSDVVRVGTALFEGLATGRENGAAAGARA